MEIRLSIVVPCYDEARNILPLVTEFEKFIQDDMELILVNNGSYDATGDLIDHWTKVHKWIKPIHINKNIGYGNGIWEGIKKAKGGWIGWTHADLQTDPHYILDAVLIADKSQNIFIKGRRKGRPLMDRFFTFGMSCFVSLILGKVIYDIHAQPNLAPREFYTDLNPPKDWAFDSYMFYMAKKKGLNIIRFPVNFGTRQYGESSWNTSITNKWKFIKRTIISSWRMRKNVKR